MSAIIFDFDGTIADSLDYFIDYIAAKAARNSLTADERGALHHHSVYAVARLLGHPVWRMPRLFFQGRHQMQISIPNLQPFEGMAEVIKKLHTEGHRMFIVTSNSRKNVRQFLRKLQLEDCFERVYGGVVVFGKAPALRRLVATHDLSVSDCVLVGDELRDIQAAQSLGMGVVAVAWGFAKPADLNAAKPTAVVGTPPELLKVLQEY